MLKAAFLDRDGTIVRDYPDEVWASITAPELLPGAAEGLRRIRSCGYQIILVTNQYIIGEGVVTQAQYDAFTARLLALLRGEGVAVLDVLHCPHRRDAGCRCCKPRHGMIEQAYEKYPDIDRSRSFVAGDSPSDRGLAENAGLRFYGVGQEGESGIADLAALGRLLAAECRSDPMK